MAFNFQKRRPDEEPPTIPQQGQQQPPTGQPAMQQPFSTGTGGQAFMPKQPPSTGVPGVQQPQGIDPKMAAMLLTRQKSKPTITKEDVAKAATILKEYKDGKPTWRIALSKTNCGGSCATGRRSATGSRQRASGGRNAGAVQRLAFQLHLKAR